jgi:integrase
LPTIRERGGKFHVQVRMSGFPARTASFPTRRQAERWAKTVEAEMIEGKHFRSVEARRRTLSDAIDRYLEHEVGKLRNGNMHRTNLPYWREALGRLKLSEITPAIIVEHRDELAAGTYTRAKPGAPGSTLDPGDKPREFKRKPGTVNGYLVSLGSVLSTARREWHWMTHNPMDGVSKLNPGKGRLRYLSDAERKRFLKETAKDPLLHTVVVLALSTAARAGEIANLRWSDIEYEDRAAAGGKGESTARVLLRETKNATPRSVWLHGEALRLLKEHGKVRRLNDDRVFVSPKGKQYRYSYKEPFAAACKAAGIQDFTFHGLRHSAATYLAREGATEQQLKAIGGWKSNVVSRYVHLAAEDAKAVLEKMNDRIMGKDVVK